MPAQGAAVMALQAIQRRVGKLETVFVVDRFADYPPLSHEEIVALVEREAGGGEWTAEETARVAKQCPYIQGELIITRGWRGEIGIKRLVGIDMATDV